MKAFSSASRILLGLVFLASGIGGWLPGHAPSFPTTIARDYMAVMQATPYGHILFAGQILCGLLLLANWFVPLVLTVLAAYLFNICMFHLFLEPDHYVVLVVLMALWAGACLRYRETFRPLLLARPAVLKETS